MALPAPGPESTVVVTGASSGIGAELARGLARRGHGVTLVARRVERLRELAEELASANGVRAEAIGADLTDEAARDRLEAEVRDRGLAVEILVNNAGSGIYRPFAATPRADLLRELRLLAEAPLDLTARWLPGMVERGRGAIVNVSSTSAFQALPGNAGYAAAKAHLLLHSEALHEELRPHGITVTAVCPGPVRTEFQEVSDPAFISRMPKLLWIGPERVAEEALRAAEKGRCVVVPGGMKVRAAFSGNRVAPPGLKRRIARAAMSRELERG